MKNAIVSLLILLACNQAAAEVLPVEQWTPEARITLARALVAEATWSSTDHAAISWVLKKRWEMRRKRRPSWSFTDQIIAYCSGMRITTPRTKWVKALPETPTDDPPEHWRKPEVWPAYRPHWERVLELVDRWQAGEVKDPCRGRALHWGSVEDSTRPTRGGWRPVRCGATYNIFWQHAAITHSAEP